VIVPVVDGQGSPEALYRDLAPASAAQGSEFEVIFAIQSGRRDVLERLRSVRSTQDRIRIVQIEHAASEATLIEVGAAHASYPVIAIVPSYRPITTEGFRRLLRALREEGVDLVTAERHPRGDPILNRIQTRLLRGLLRHTVWVRFRDVGSGVRVLRREVLDEIPLYAEYARFLPVLAVRAGFRVAEVKVPQHPDDRRLRLHAPGTYLRRIVDLIGLAFLVRFTRKPLRFFGFVGAALAAAGAVTLLGIAGQRFGGQPLADRPLLLLGVLFFVLGTQSIGLGLIGELIVHFNASRTRGYRLAADSQDADGGVSRDEMGVEGDRAG
jgi:hypothetical protein